MTNILANAQTLSPSEARLRVILLAQREHMCALALCAALGKLYAYEKHNFSKVQSALAEEYEAHVKRAEAENKPVPPRPIYAKDQSGILSVNQARKYAVVGAYFLRAKREGVSITDFDALRLINDLGIEALALLAKLSEARTALDDYDTMISYHNEIERAVRERNVKYADVVRYLREENETIDSAIERAVVLKAAREAKAKAKASSESLETVRADGSDVIDPGASLEAIARKLLERAAWDVERAQKALLNAIVEYERARAQAVSQAVETVAVA